RSPGTPRSILAFAATEGTRSHTAIALIDNDTRPWRRSMRGISLLPLVCLAACGLARPACAEGGNPLHQKIALSLGVFNMSSDTSVRADGLNGNSIGDRIDLERNLDVLNENVFRAELLWRFLERHKLLLMYIDTSREGRRVIDRDIHFGDTTFPIDAEV